MTVHVVRLVSDVQRLHGLGRHVDHDSRSLLYAFTPAAPLPTKPVEWGISIPPLNQGQTSACTGNAFAQFLNTDFAASLRKKMNKEFFTEEDALDIYGHATHDDGLHDASTGYYPPDDTGSSGLGAVKACQELGYVSTYQHTFSFQMFLHALATQPVCVGTAWTNDMENADENGLVSVGSLDDSNIAGGHEYLAIGFNPLTQLIKFRNSWGNDWGIDGDFFVSYSDYQQLLVNQGDVVVPQIAA
jgi:hypothetical protein